MRGCQFINKTICLVILFSGVASLGAIPIETGLTYSPSMRHSDRFGSGIEKYHSSLSFRRLNINQGDPPERFQSFEFWIRFDELLANDHWFGLAAGRYFSDRIAVRELTYSPSYSTTMLDSTWSFSLPFFAFTYGYRHRISRRANLDLGVDFGFLLEPRWRINGYRLIDGNYQSYNSSHRAKYGNIWRLHLGLSVPVSNLLMIRGGIRISYLTAGGFAGELNGLESSWYYAGDNGLIQLSSQDVLSLYTQYQESEVAALYNISLLKEEAVFTTSLSEFYLALVVRFP